jgi:arylsulfatase A-like enzyme
MSQRPNIIWVFGDQHRAQALSIAGDPNVSTPNLDRMAIEGQYFPRAAANNPWCCPFRWMAMTGRYSHHGVCKTPMAMKPEDRTVAHELGDVGYRTHYVGKWHLGGSNQSIAVPPELRGGFETFIGYENNNNQYHCPVHGHDENGEREEELLKGYETDALTDIFIDRLKKEAASGDDTPFFAALSVQPPHNPYVAPAEEMARHRPANIKLRPNVPPIPRIEEEARNNLAGYYAQIENLDANLGRVVAALEETGLLHNTYIFFFSDHGDCHGSHGHIHKSSPWEESIRIPFFIGGGLPHIGFDSGPKPHQISAVDIAPTTLGLAGVEAPEIMQGYDYSPLRRGEKLHEAPDSVFCQQVVRKRHAGGIDQEWRTVSTNDGWKYTCIPGAPHSMFNLNEDPYEMNNLILMANYNADRKRLHERLKKWIQDTGDEFDLYEPWVKVQKST